MNNISKVTTKKKVVVTSRLSPGLESALPPDPRGMKWMKAELKKLSMSGQLECTYIQARSDQWRLPCCHRSSADVLGRKLHRLCFSEIIIAMMEAFAHLFVNREQNIQEKRGNRQYKELLLAWDGINVLRTRIAVDALLVNFAAQNFLSNIIPVVYKWFEDASLYGMQKGHLFSKQ